MKKEYVISLDIGTSSVGWAVLDHDFNLATGKKRIVEINEHGEKNIRKVRTNLWGVRLFDEGETAENRRLKRGMRRRIARRKKRLAYLQGLFQKEISTFDDSFFIRLEESFRQKDDKTVETKYPLFNGKVGSGESFASEVDYYTTYPTIYHLRKRLVEDPSQADLRLVYLGLHHIAKFRGHFTNQGQSFDLKNIDASSSLHELICQFDKWGNIDRKSENHLKKANEILVNRKLSRKAKTERLADLYNIGNKVDDTKQKALFTAAVGNGIDIAKIFNNEEYKSNSEENNIPKAGDFKFSNEKFDDTWAEIQPYLQPEELEILETGKKVYESLVLSQILTQETLAASMVEKFNTHKRQLGELKAFTKSISPKAFDEFFKKNGIYDGFIQGTGDPAKVTTRDDFYKKIKKFFEEHLIGLKFPDGDKDFDFSHIQLTDEQKDQLKKIHEEIIFEVYLPKQRMNDNGAIPYQVHEHELVEIIKNQSPYYPFLGEKVILEDENDEGETTQKEEYKIQSLFKFRIPYYVGTLAQKSGWILNDKKELQQAESPAKNSWLVRRCTEKITPWNFSKVVDKEQSAANFIERMTGFDTYLPNEKVLPHHSLLYQEFVIYNELMTSGWFEKGKKQYFSPELRQEIVNELFKSSKKVSAQKMIGFLNTRHPGQFSLNLNQELFGLDTFVSSPSYNSTFSSYIDLKSAGVTDEMIENRRDIFEQIIKWQTIFEDRKILKRTIKNANQNHWDHLLTEEQIVKLSRKHYTGWGKLSKRLLDGLTTKNGKTIIENLKQEKYNNFMRLLEDEKIVKAIEQAQSEKIDNLSLNYGMVANLAGSPKIKKGIWQTLQVIKELEQFLGRAKISKIVIEMARDQDTGRTQSRQKQIEKFYANFQEKNKGALDHVWCYSESDFKEVKEESKRDQKFDDDKVYLYFLQNGVSMYGGAKLDLDHLSDYEVDHIIPQNFIKDDSFDNKVLVLKSENQHKGGNVPSKEIINKMKSFWELLAKSGQISPRKLANLTIGVLSEDQKKGFIKRQLVETRQITKHVANILAGYFGKDQKKIEVLTPKAGLTSQFRKGEVFVPKEEFDLTPETQKGNHYEWDGKEFFPDGQIKESKYQDSKFVKVHIHEGFTKLRDLNDYHHAHDAYLNGIVAIYIYKTRPDLRNMWVYGEYQRQEKREIGKFGHQRKEFFKQLLTGMIEKRWLCYELNEEDFSVYTNGEFWDPEEVLDRIRKNLRLRHLNIVKKIEMQTGKFGDESVYKKDATATNFANGLKKELIPQNYGGTKAPISAFGAIIQNKKGEIKVLSIPAMISQNYGNTPDKLSYLQEIYPKEKIEKVLVPQVLKYTKYILPNGGVRLLASYQEAQNGMQLPMMKMMTNSSTDQELTEIYCQLAQFIFVNKLFAEKKLPLLLDGAIRSYFDQASCEEKRAIIAELARVAKGSNQGLKTLQKAGLGDSKQRLTSVSNLITNGTTLVYQSATGLYETRKTLPKGLDKKS